MAIKYENFNIDNIILLNKTRNTIVNNGYFYRIYYSSKNFCSNGIYIFFKLREVNVEKYFNKIKCSFSGHINKKAIADLINIEEKILERYKLPKKRRLRIHEQLLNKYIKLISHEFNDWGERKNINLMLKLSGLWESNEEYGITFRFYIVNRPL